MKTEIMTVNNKINTKVSFVKFRFKKKKNDLTQLLSLFSIVSDVWHTID